MMQFGFMKFTTRDGFTFVHITESKNPDNKNDGALISYQRPIIVQTKEKIKIIGQTHNMDIVPRSYRQLDAMNTTLPTGARFVGIMCSITSEELSVFIPFNVQEIHDSIKNCYP